MGRSKKYKVADFEAVIPGSGGIMSTIASRVGCDWMTARKYINDSTKLTEMYEAEIAKNADVAESVVIANIKAAARMQFNSGYTAMIDSGDAKWYLSQKAKDRGYGTQTIDATLKHEGDIDVTFVDYRQGLAVKDDGDE